MAHDGYRVRIFDDIIWVYEYQPDGITASVSKLFINNPQGHGLWLREKSRFMGDSFVKKVKVYYSFYCDHRHHLSCKKIAQYIGAPVILIRLFKTARYFLDTLRKS